MAISGGRDDGEPMMEMNTTPLIDVMLVLLIMFIITIPVQTHAVKIDLPTDQAMSDPPPIDPVKNKLVIGTDDTLRWNDTPITLDELGSILSRTQNMDPVPELQFQPDPQSRYEIVDKTLAVIKDKEITKMGFVGNEQYGNFGKAGN